MINVLNLANLLKCCLNFIPKFAIVILLVVIQDGRGEMQEEARFGPLRDTSVKYAA